VNTNNDGWVEYPNTEHLSWRKGRMEFPDQGEVKSLYDWYEKFYPDSWRYFQKYNMATNSWVDLTEPPVWEPWNIYKEKVEIPNPEPCKLCNEGRGCNGDCYYEDFNGDDHEDYSSK
jgi:radical SAM protein with 4Fe4S-binding SPASM domain